jgi:hypothetical protein
MQNKLQDVLTNNLKDTLTTIDKKVDYLRELRALYDGDKCCEEVIQKFKKEHNAEIVERLQESTTPDNFTSTSTR